jgi:hypothetical protein
MRHRSELPFRKVPDAEGRERLERRSPPPPRPRTLTTASPTALDHAPTFIETRSTSRQQRGCCMDLSVSSCGLTSQRRVRQRSQYRPGNGRSAPLVYGVAGGRRHLIGDGFRSEHKVELAGRRRRSLSPGVVGRHIDAVLGQLGRPRLRLSTVRRLRPKAPQTHRFGAVEDRRVAGLPVRESCRH